MKKSDTPEAETPTPPPTPAKAAAAQRPGGGGSYIRKPDGSLVKKEV